MAALSKKTNSSGWRRSPPASTSAFASASSSAFSPSRSPSFLSRSASPPPTIRFSFDGCSILPPRGGVRFAGERKPVAGDPASRRKTCACSPTTHPGSYRCSLHKRHAAAAGGGGGMYPKSSPNRLNARRSAMTNSLVRIGTVEGELVKRALAALVRPCAHHQRRRAAFQPRPSRLSVMSKAEDL